MQTKQQANHMEDYNDKPARFVSEFINFLTKALPIRSIPTFIELLVVLHTLNKQRQNVV